MTNMEYYKDKLLDMLCAGTAPAINKNHYELTTCNEVACSDCLFKSDVKNCKQPCREWLEKEHATANIDWSKVPKDTKVLVRDIGDYKWRRRYFAGYEEETVLAYPNGSTSWSYDPEHDLTSWDEAKLADPEDEEKY